MGNIEIKNLTKTFGDIQALSNFSFVFEKGKKYSVIGEKGSGKTTLLNIVAGLESYDGGSIKIDGVERKSVSLEDANMSYILSKPLFFENKSLLYNLEYLCKVCSKSISRDELIHTIEEHNLDPKEKVKKLTYLEKLMLSIVRSKIKNSEILIVDLNEIIENIDSKSGAFTEVVSWLKSCSGTVIVAENGVNFASNFTDNILFLSYGVNKGLVSLKDEIENPSNFYLYKCALNSLGNFEKEKIIEVEKSMCGISISSSGLTLQERKNLENILARKNDFKVNDKIEVLKLGNYYFEKIGGKILV